MTVLKCAKALDSCADDTSAKEIAKPMRQPSAVPVRVLTIDDVCCYLGVSHETIYRLIKRKRFPAFRLAGESRAWRINVEDLERWIKRKSISGKTSITRDSRTR
jgi:excisionase family DNA binding protein